MANELFLNIEDYIFFTSISIVCCQKLRHIARLTNAAVIGISKSTLDDSAPTSEIQIDVHDLHRCDTDIEEGYLAISEITSVIMLNHISLKT